jgi:PPOX class probable F420-dependent enzyme
MSTSKLEAFLTERRDVIVAGIRKDGRPHLTPNWFYWDGSKFYVSTTRLRAKYNIFRRDPRVQLLIDDDAGHRATSVYGTVEIREDVKTELDLFRAIGVKYGRNFPDDEGLTAMLLEQDRVLLAITPDGPLDTWMTIDLD